VEEEGEEAFSHSLREEGEADYLDAEVEVD